MTDKFVKPSGTENRIEMRLSKLGQFDRFKDFRSSSMGDIEVRCFKF